MTHPGVQVRNPETGLVIVRIYGGESLRRRQSLIIVPFIRGLTASGNPGPAGAGGSCVGGGRASDAASKSEKTITTPR